MFYEKKLLKGKQKFHFPIKSYVFKFIPFRWNGNLITLIINTAIISHSDVTLIDILIIWTVILFNFHFKL